MDDESWALLVNAMLRGLENDDDRLAALDFITAGICTECGEVVGERRCHCTNDE